MMACCREKRRQGLKIVLGCESNRVRLDQICTWTRKVFAEWNGETMLGDDATTQPTGLGSMLCQSEAQPTEQYVH